MLPFDSQDSLRRSNLSPSQQHLVDVMQELQFGRIQSLTIRSGQPVLTEETKIWEAVKLDQPAQARKSAESTIFGALSDLPRLCRRSHAQC